MNTFFKCMVICSLSLANCRQTDSVGKETYHEYWLNNQSGKQVTLHLYRIDKVLHNSFNVKPDSLYLMESGIEDPAFGQTYYLTNRLDSAVFVFDDQKKLVQTYLKQEMMDTLNNVLSATYYQLKQDGRKKVFTFTLTAADYQRAQ